MAFVTCDTSTWMGVDRAALRLFLVVGATALTLLVAAPAASACSCAPIDPRDAFAEADAAILGEVVAREVESESTIRHTIRVTRTFKGTPGEEVVLRSDANSSCSNDYEVGTRVSLLLHLWRGRWTTFACDYLSPEQMARASRPLPRPNGRPPARLLLGGSLGPARTIALGSLGGTIAYGFRDGLTWNLAACPGATRVAEHATVGRRHVIVMRRLPSLAFMWRRTLGREQWTDVHAIACNSRSGQSVVAFVADHTSAPNRLVGVGRGAVRTIWTGTGRFPAIGRDRAYVLRTRGFVAVDLRTGAERWVAQGRTFGGTSALNRAGRLLALQTRTGLAVYDVTGEPRLLAERDFVAEVSGTLAWGTSRLGIFPSLDDIGQAQVYTPTLEHVRTFGWNGASPVILNGTVYGIASNAGWDSQVVARGLRSGALRVLRRLDTPELYELAAIPSAWASSAARQRRESQPPTVVVTAGCRGPVRARASSARARSAL